MSVTFDNVCHIWHWLSHLTLTVTSDKVCHIWHWLSHLTLTVTSDNGSHIWHWLSHLTLSVTSDNVCHVWQCLSRLTLTVTSDNGCHIWHWLSHLKMSVASDNGCHIWQWLSHLTMADNRQNTHSAFHETATCIGCNVIIAGKSSSAHLMCSVWVPPCLHCCSCCEHALYNEHASLLFITAASSVVLYIGRYTAHTHTHTYTGRFTDPTFLIMPYLTALTLCLKHWRLSIETLHLPTPCTSLNEALIISLL